MGGGGYNLSVMHGILVQARRHQPRYMGHVNHKYGPYFVGYFSEFLKIQSSGIGACPRHDKLGFMLKGNFSDLVIIHIAVVFSSPVRHEIKIRAAHTGLAAVGEVSAVAEIHSHYGIAHIQ